MLHVKYIEDLEDIMDAEQVNKICTRGPNDQAVKDCVSAMWGEWIIDAVDAIEILAETGAWSRKELRREDISVMIERLVWIAAWNVHERGEDDDTHAPT